MSHESYESLVSRNLSLRRWFYQRANKKGDAYGILRLFQEQSNKGNKGLSFFTKYLHLHKFLAGDSLLPRVRRCIYIRECTTTYVLVATKGALVATTSICTKEDHSFPTQNVHELFRFTGQKN